MFNKKLLPRLTVLVVLPCCVRVIQMKLLFVFVDAMVFISMPVLFPMHY